MISRLNGVMALAVSILGMGDSVPTLNDPPPENVAPWEKDITIQKKSRIGSHTPKKERNRNGKRYYRNGTYF